MCLYRLCPVVPFTTYISSITDTSPLPVRRQFFETTANMGSPDVYIRLAERHRNEYRAQDHLKASFEQTPLMSQSIFLICLLNLHNLLYFPVKRPSPPPSPFIRTKGCYHSCLSVCGVWRGQEIMVQVQRLK